MLAVFGEALFRLGLVPNDEPAEQGGPRLVILVPSRHGGADHIAEQVVGLFLLQRVGQRLGAGQIADVEVEHCEVVAGIGVDLVIPARSNHRMADLARHASLRELTRSGARVWLSPTMVHAKAVVFDGEFAMAGSANLDERSLFLNYELMVGFYRPDDVRRFAQWIERQRQGARPYVARRPSVLRELGEGAIRWLAFQL